MLSSFEAAVPMTQGVSKCIIQETSLAQKHDLLHGRDSTSSSNNTLVFTKDLNFGDGSEIIVTGLLNKVHSTMTDLEATGQYDRILVLLTYITDLLTAEALAKTLAKKWNSACGL